MFRKLNGITRQWEIVAIQMKCFYFQTEIVQKLHSSHHPNITEVQALKQDAYPLLCQGLRNISDTCFVPNLSQCYDSHDAHFHFVYMLEELKTASIMLAIHLLSNTSTIDILQCPVFVENSPFQENSANRATIIALALVLSFFLLAVVIASGAFLTHKFRLVPRLRAWLQNEPYQDVVNEMSTVVPSSPGDELRNDLEEARECAQEPLPSLEELKGSATQHAVANLRDQSEPSGQST